MEAILNWLAGIAEHIAGTNLFFLFLGVVLHLLSQAVRQQAWIEMLKVSYPDSKPSSSSIIEAHFAGSWTSSIIPKSGQIVRLFFIRNQVKDSRLPTLASMYIPEAIGEFLLSLPLVIWLVYQGILTPDIFPSVPLEIIVGVVAVCVFIATWHGRGRISSFINSIKAGLKILKSPRSFAKLLGWQLISRFIRLFSLVALLAAFHLPSSLLIALLIMGVYAVTAIVPVAAVSAGLRVAILATGLSVLGMTVGSVALMAFLIASSSVITLANIVVGIGCFTHLTGVSHPSLILSKIRHIKDSVAIADAPVPVTVAPSASNTP